jgi:lysozyme family protein
MFTEALPFILKEEGGFVNDPSDSGGATNKGVTQVTYDTHRKLAGYDPRHVKYITNEEVSKIYESYWNDSRSSELPIGLNLMHFDFAVNAGIRRAALTLQKILGVEQDGVIGIKTLTAAEEKNDESLISAYAAERREFYNGLATRRPKDKRFLKGWLLRVGRCERRAIKIYREANPSSGPSTV